MLMFMCVAAQVQERRASESDVKHLQARMGTGSGKGTVKDSFKQGRRF